MTKQVEFELRRQETHDKLVMIRTLRAAGLINVMKSASECRALYGKWFTDHVKSGDLAGVRTGGRTLYSIESINALQDAELAAAAKRAEIK